MQVISYTSFKRCVRRTGLWDEVGLTLIEMLLAITIIGLILSYGLTAWLSMKSSQQISAAATIVKMASECLENYVILSGKIPPQSFFAAHCVVLDPWQNQLIYENNGDDQEIASVVAKTFRDENGDHPDAAWIIASTGPDGARSMTTSATVWNCSTGDDLCRIVTKNALLYEIHK